MQDHLNPTDPKMLTLLRESDAEDASQDALPARPDEPADEGDGNDAPPPNGEQQSGPVSTFVASGGNQRSTGFTRLSDVKTERITWRSPGRVAAGKFHTFDGDPGVGKSTLLLDWAARRSSGRALPGGQPSAPRGVAILGAEDGLSDTVRPRLEAAGADLDRIIVLDEKPDGSGYVLPGDIRRIEQIITAEDIGMFIIDPGNAYVDPALDVFKDQHVRRVTTPLAAMADRTGADVHFVRHLNKQAGQLALYRGGGSIAIVGAARIGLLVAIHPKDPDLRIVAPVKSNLYGRSGSLAFRLVPVPGTDVARVEYVGTSTLTADDLVAPAAEAPTSPKREDAKVFLTELLGQGPVPATLVREKAGQEGFSWATVRRASDELGVETAKIAFGDGHWEWSMPVPEAEPPKMLTEIHRGSPAGDDAAVEGGDTRDDQPDINSALGDDDPEEIAFFASVA